MNLAEKILVVFLSAFLTIFLLLAIILIINVLKLTKKMNIVADKAGEIFDKANDIADKVDSVSDMFQKSAGPLALGKYFMNFAEAVLKHKKRK